MIVKDVALQTAATRPVDLSVPRSDSDQRFAVALAKTDMKIDPREVADQTDNRVQKNDKTEAVHGRVHREQSASNDESENAGESNSSDPVATRAESEKIDKIDDPKMLDKTGDIAIESYGDPVDLGGNGNQVQEEQQSPWVDPTLSFSQPNIIDPNRNNSRAEIRTDAESEQHAILTTNTFTGSSATEGSVRLTGPVTENFNSVMTAPVISSVLQRPTPLPQVVPVIESQLPNIDGSNDATNLSRVVRGLRGVVNQHGGSVTLRLHPPDFGFVRVQMNLQDGTVNATIQSEHAAVRAMLSQQLSHLRHSLETQGLFVERLSVQAPQPQQVSTTTDQQSDDGFRQQPEGRSRGGYGGRDGRKDQDSQEASEVSSQPENFQQALVNEVV